MSRRAMSPPSSPSSVANDKGPAAMSSTFSWPGAISSAGLGDLRREAKSLGQLALPLILVYAGYNVMNLVDTIFVGRLDAAALGAVGIGNSIMNALALVG